MTWLAFLLTLFGSSWACVGIYRWYAVRNGLLDEPNARSSHYAATPRGGGVVFFVGWMILLGVLYYYSMVPQDFLWVFSPAAIFGLLGFWDDHKSLSSTLRFIIQCIAATITLVLLEESGELLQTWLNYDFPLAVYFGLSVFAIVWSVNLFNFMDGSDGIAAVEAMFVFGLGGYFLFQFNAIELGILAWGLTAILAGFLVWNWPVASIFMGDSGSYFLGFMIIFYALISHKFFGMPFAIWGILTGLFWFDATITLLRRMIAREEWRKAHRSHAYQRLIQAGWSHQKVLLGAISVNAILGGFAYVAYYDPRLEYFALAITVILLSCLYIMVEIAKPMFKTWATDAPEYVDAD